MIEVFCFTVELSGDCRRDVALASDLTDSDYRWLRSLAESGKAAVLPNREIISNVTIYLEEV